VRKKLFAAVSAIALLPLSAPALAQPAGHTGMTMPMPAPKKAPAKKKATAKATAKKKATATTEAQSSDHSAMDRGSMPMPAEQVTPPVDHSTMEHEPVHAEPAPGSADAPMDHSQMDHAAMGHEMPAEGGHAGHGAVTGAFGSYPMSREASGTAWQPDASEHEGIHVTSGEWTLMGHGTLNLVYDHQSGRRGDDKLFAAGMLMGMARRPLGDGTLQFKAMVSPDPLMGKSGYPLLLASGETADGETHLIDRQHPHDFFMELSASIFQNIGPKSSVFLFGGLPGEPAFGPPAFMHREAIMDSPEAPIGHHWLDSTHISFGVLTGGIVLDRFKLEVSRFNGREPDQYRWNIETGPLDSTAVRMSWNPTDNLSLQGSWGHFEDAEQLEPGVNQKRWSASLLYARDIAPHWKLAGTLAWGRKTIAHHGEALKDDAFVAEASLKHRQWTIFGRGEVTENRELLDTDEHGPAFRVGKVSLGAVRDFKLADHLSLGIGGQLAVNFIPGGLEPLYGGKHPIGTMGFLRLKAE
jgi:hypothetical protein